MEPARTETGRVRAGADATLAAFRADAARDRDELRARTERDEHQAHAYRDELTQLRAATGPVTDTTPAGCYRGPGRPPGLSRTMPPHRDFH